jgi:hypothetical protein
VADILNEIESAVAEVPENLGRVLTFLGQKLEELAARMDKLDGGGAGGQSAT